MDVKITDSTIVQPDCLVICDKADGTFIDFPPALAVEVLSKSTSLKDQHTKYALYQNFGIKYYIIVNPDTGGTEIYRLEDKIYVRTKPDGANTFTFELEAGCHIRIDIGNFWK